MCTANSGAEAKDYGVEKTDAVSSEGHMRVWASACKLCVCHFACICACVRVSAVPTAANRNFYIFIRTCAHDILVLT